MKYTSGMGCAPPLLSFLVMGWVKSVDLKALRRAGLVLAAVFGMQSAAFAADRALSFHVLNQHSVALTAHYWNPILTYASQKSGVLLELKLTKTSREGDANAEKVGYHFLYTNHFFTPERDRLGYRVIARPAGPGIRGQIVVPRDSAIRSLQDLEGKEIAVPSPDAFVGYWLPMDALLKAGVNAKTVFAGNQEAAFEQLRIGKVAAAGVNSEIMARYSRREGFDYRALWTSEIYNDLCIMANPNVPGKNVAAVRAAFLNMAHDPAGRKILEAGAELLKIKGELGFVAADNRDYDDYRSFYRKTSVKAPTKD